MPPAFELQRRIPDGVDAVIVPFTTEAVSTGSVLGELAVDLEFLASQGFEGKVGHLTTVPGGSDAIDVIALGVGPAADVTPAVVRKVAARAARSFGKRAVVATLLLEALADPADRPAAAQALAEGTVLAGYKFSRYKSAEPDAATLERIVVVGAGGARVERAIELGSTVAAGIIVARDLVNMPGGDLTAPALADFAKGLATEGGVTVKVLDEKAIVKAKLGGLLGVNRGSTIPPRFIELLWDPPGAKATLSLVGKGITFDSGGLSIKSGEGMMTMKDDMGGAAAVLGTFSVLAAIAPKIRVRGYIPATDNMSGGDATRPGDVLTIRNGKTVEVLNTDAEGRLVLADALTVASEAEPDAIIDLATLTGAVEVALGNRIAGVMGNKQTWVDQVSDAAGRAGERVWQLPLPADYHERIESDIADLRNIGKGRGAGTITAGLFLQDFVADGIPWVHLDIAATAWTDKSDGENTPGGTGWGVRTLVEVITSFKKPR